MTSLDRVAASVSAQAYAAPPARSEHLIGDWRIDRTVSTGDVAVYVNDARKQVLVGFRGTTLSRDDLLLVGSLISGVGKTDAHVARGAETVAQVRAAHTNKSVLLTGHSKGAWLASKVAQPNERVIGFAPATSVADILQSYKAASVRRPTVVYHSVAGDVLSIPSYFLHGAKHKIQTRSLLSLFAQGSLGVRNAHSISNFL